MTEETLLSRVRRLAEAAGEVELGAYPAHGAGFVTIVSKGDGGDGSPLASLLKLRTDALALVTLAEDAVKALEELTQAVEATEAQWGKRINIIIHTLATEASALLKRAKELT